MFKNGHRTVALTARKQELCQLFTGRPDTIELQPGGWTLPAAYTKYADQLYDFQFYEDDVIVHSFPKSGTTWTQEIVWTMMKNPDLNMETPEATKSLFNRSPILEFDILCDHMPEAMKTKQDLCPGTSAPYMQDAIDSPRPRILKTHLSPSLFNPEQISKPKMIYIVRDPRDACISFFHHSKLFKAINFTGSFDQYVDAFMEDAALYATPYWNHVNECWQRRYDPKMHLIFYNKMKKYPFKEYKKLALFLGKEFTDEQLEKIVHYTSFGEMKMRNTHAVQDSDTSIHLNTDYAKKEGGFFRKGVSGDWKNTLSQEQKDKFDSWIEKSCPCPQIMKYLSDD